MPFDKDFEAAKAASLDTFKKEEGNLEAALKASLKPNIKEPVIVEGFDGKIVDCGTGGLNLCGPLTLAYLLPRYFPKFFEGISTEMLIKMFDFDIPAGNYRDDHWFQKVADKIGCVIKVYYLEVISDDLTIISEALSFFRPPVVFFDQEINFIHDSVKEHYMAYLPDF